MNEEITEPQVYLYDATGALDLVPTGEALARAREQQADLVCEWADPPRPPAGAPVCRLVHLAKPLRWEALPATPGGPTDPDVDAELWFETAHCDCGGPHYLLGNPHTFPGRLSAWCPTKKQSYCASKSDIERCSREAALFVRGYLAGQEPEPPVDDEGDALPPDHPAYRAWRAAVDLFDETGVWNGRFRVCRSCGARLLPSNPAEVCRSCPQGQ